MPEREPKYITFINPMLFSHEIMEQMKPELLWQGRGEAGFSPSLPRPLTSRLSLEA